MGECIGLAAAGLNSKRVLVRCAEKLRQFTLSAADADRLPAWPDAQLSYNCRKRSGQLSFLGSSIITSFHKTSKHQYFSYTTIGWNGFIGAKRSQCTAAIGQLTLSGRPVLGTSENPDFANHLSSSAYFSSSSNWGRLRKRKIKHAKVYQLAVKGNVTSTRSPDLDWSLA